MDIKTREDGWWNLTKLAQDHGRAIADFLRLKSTKAFITALERELGCPVVEVTVGGTTCGSSWGHPLVGSKCLAWVSPEHEVAVYKAASQTMTTAQPLRSV